MSHIEQIRFVESVKNQFPKNFTSCKVLEVGSLDINGSVRQCFIDCEYVGVDLQPGKGVDLVGPVHTLLLGKYDTVISCECFEHDKYWKETFQKMYDSSRFLVLFSCATTGRSEHGTTRTSPQDSPFTNDYYMNLTAQDFINAFDLDKMFSKYEFSSCERPADLYFWGIK
jgi:hypothetical protein